MAKSWAAGVQDKDTLAKYQAVLDAAGKERLDLGGSPGQDIGYSIDLRNALIHYQPEFLPASGRPSPKRTPKSKSRSEALEVGLRGKFPLNPWYKETGNPFFPYKYLGHGCAEWAVRSSLAFLGAFFERLGVASMYEALRPHLATRST
jgi:hypothetical protein